MSGQQETREIAAATLAAVLIQGQSLGPTAEQAARTYYDVLEALNAEHDKRAQAKHVPGFDRKLEYPKGGH